MSIQETLYLINCADFYGMHSDAAINRFKRLVENRLTTSIDMHNSLIILDQAEKLQAQRIKAVVLKFIAQNFAMFSTNQNLCNELYSLDKVLLVEIIKAKALLDSKK